MRLPTATSVYAGDFVTNDGSINHELVCNLAGHYRSGMFTELTVT